MATPKAGLKTMPTGTTKNEAVFNEDLILLEALVYRGVASRSTVDPSVLSPTNGDIYLVPDGSPNAVGDWAGLGGQIAVYYNGWRYLPPDEGITLWITDESQSVQYRNGVWTDVDEFPPTVLSDLDDVSLGGSPSPQQGDVLVYNAELGEWMASGLAPTRTTVTLSGASTNVSIPAGCKWFRMVSEEITLTNGAGNLTAELYHTGNTVRQTFKTLLTAIQLSAAVSVGTGNTSFAFAGNTSSATSRGLAGTIHSPRDATKKSMGDGRGYNTTGNVFRYRDVVANSAVDDDTVRIVTDAGTITGTVHFEWFYS